jgi:hypothetical protein
VEQCQTVKKRLTAQGFPSTPVIVYCDNLRVQPFYAALQPIMRDPQYQDFFLRDTNKTNPNAQGAAGYIPATTYCAQMHQPHYDPKCLCWYWNLFNDSAVEFYLNTLLLPQASKPGFNGVFFDGSDGFMRGTWKQATNVPPGLTDSDALQAVISFHKKGAELLQKHGKYAIYSEHLTDTTPEQQRVYSTQMQDTGFFRFYEGFHATVAYIEMILNETQPTNDLNPLPVILHSGSSSGLSSFAAFLIVRTNYSYFMASNGWLDGGWSWHPYYDLDIGEPLGPAEKRVGSDGGPIYTRSYSKHDVTVDCSANASLPDNAVGLQAPWDCKIVNCSCQDFANYYSTHPDRGFGCAPVAAQNWWKHKPCNKYDGAEKCCGGPACSLPGHAPCICPHGPGPWPAPTTHACTGTIKIKNDDGRRNDLTSTFGTLTRVGGKTDDASATVLFVTEAIQIQGEKSGGTPTNMDGSCACPGHPTRTFCPLDSTKGQCDKASHKPCKHGGHCAPAPPQLGLPVSTSNPSITVDSNGTVVLIAQTNIQTHKNQQRPFTTISMVSSKTNGRTWSNVTQMGPPGAPQSVFSKSSGTLFLFGKSANMLDNGTRPELPDTCWQSTSTQPGDPTAWSPAIPMTVRGTVVGPHFAGGSRTHGIELERGPHKGRLILPRLGNPNTVGCRGHIEGCKSRPPIESYAIYSDDQGATWQTSATLSSGDPADTVWDECTLTEMRNGSVLMSARIDDLKNMDRHHPDTNVTRMGRSRGFARSDNGGATWAEQWTLWERQPEIPDSPCSDAMVYSNKTGAMYFGHPGEWLDNSTGPTPATGARSNYTILRSLDEGASWHFLQLVFSAGAGYSDMHLLPSSKDEAGDLFGVAFQMSTSWHNGKPMPAAYNGEREHMSMGWAVVHVPSPSTLLNKQPLKSDDGPLVTTTNSNSTASWLQKREAMRHAIWGTTQLPTRSQPDSVTDVVNASAGAPASAGVQRVIWNVSNGFFPLSSTTYYVPQEKGRRTKALMIHHHGHAQACDNLDGNGKEIGCPRFWDFYNLTTFIHETLGLDALFMYMPLLGPNQQHGYPTSHQWFAGWELKGDRPISYFIEPVSLSVNYALNVLKYDEVYMMGKSGGGWSTTVAAAADPRIAASFPLAGSVPLDIKTGAYYRSDKGDYEQLPQKGAKPGNWYLDACNYTCQYLLAALEPGRTSLQILHENDPCCFRAEGRHDELLAYDASVSAELAAMPSRPPGTHGVFSTAVTDWPVHAVCPRDKALIATTLQRVREAAAAPHQMTNLSGLPCDMLRGGETVCPAELPPAAKIACADLSSQSACLASAWHCEWGNGNCIRPRPPPPPPPTPKKGGCWRGATPPCVYVQADCTVSTPTATQKWQFEKLSGGAVQIKHAADGLCLASRCLAAHGCTANHSNIVVMHNQLEVITCDATSTRQQWRVSADGEIVSEVDTGFVMNVGESPVAQMELQLYPKQTPIPQNDVFQLDGEMLRAATKYKGCVDVCQAGSKACGGGSPSPDRQVMKMDDVEISTVVKVSLYRLFEAAIDDVPAEVAMSKWSRWAFAPPFTVMAAAASIKTDDAFPSLAMRGKPRAFMRLWLKPMLPLKSDDVECCTAAQSVAVASCWGWSTGNASQNTHAIQSALDCPTAHLVIVPKMTGPWIVAPPAGRCERLDHKPDLCYRTAALNFSSYKRVIFEPGVIIEAERWGFKGVNDNLAIVGSLASPVRNLTIVGAGAVWRMWKRDYQNASCSAASSHTEHCYQISEQRHGLNLWWGEDVTVTGLNISWTGGDGIMLGGMEGRKRTYTQRVHISNTTLDSNHSK